MIFYTTICSQDKAFKKNRDYDRPIYFVKVQGSINSPVLSVIKSDHW